MAGIVATLKGMRAGFSAFGQPAYSSADNNSPELSGFHPQYTNADSAWGPARDKTVSRVSDLVRNDGWASNGLARYLDSVIGADLRLSAKPDYRAQISTDRKSVV